MPKTPADRWLEDYLREQGAEPGDHEPDTWGLDGPRPDYLAKGEGGQIAREVKQFGKGSKSEDRGQCKLFQYGRRNPLKGKTTPQSSPFLTFPDPN